MASVKYSFSIDEDLASVLQQRASEQGKAFTRYVSDLLEAEARRSRDQLAAEGYQILDPDTGQFAELTWPTSTEGLPEWKDE